MDGKDLKRIMRKRGVSVKQLARYMQSTETGIKRLLKGDTDYFWGDTLESWEKRVDHAAGYRPGSYTSP